MEQIAIDSPYITLGQLLKMVDVIQSGGHAKFFLQENDVLVNGEKEDRRGRKLYQGDLVEISSFGKFQIKGT